MFPVYSAAGTGGHFQLLKPSRGAVWWMRCSVKVESARTDHWR